MMIYKLFRSDPLKKEQEKRTLETLTGYGQEALDKVRDSFKKTIADAETRLAEGGRDSGNETVLI
jgi:hypothetical protein